MIHIVIDVTKEELIQFKSCLSMGMADGEDYEIVSKIYSQLKRYLKVIGG